MKKTKKWAKVLLVAIVLAVILATAFAIPRLGEEFQAMSDYRVPSRHAVVAVFGATGRVGSGILEACMNDAAVQRIHVVTRRRSPRIDEGVASGLVEMTTHLDYLDYSSLRDVLAEVDAAYWAIGTSAANVDKEEYTVIHVDFPKALVREWLDVRGGAAALSFHYVSGGGADTESWMHWAREKAKAEVELVELARGTGLRIISYRPGSVIPSDDRAGFGHALLRVLFLPIKLAIESPSIGRAMLEVTARGDEVPSGTILENRDILKYSNGYLTATNS